MSIFAHIHFKWRNGTSFSRKRECRYRDCRYYDEGHGWFRIMSKLKEDYELPVIMLTARDAPSDKERAFLSGTDDYVTKPFEVKELLFRIKAVLRRYFKSMLKAN